MGNNFETFILAYQAASQPIRDIIDSDEIGLFIDGLLAENSLSESHKRAFLVLISNRVLAITSDTEVINAIQALSIDRLQAEKISSSIRVFVQSKIDAVVNTAAAQNPPEEIAIVDVSPEATAAITTPTNTDVVATVPRIRTMAEDMAKSQADNEVVYSSSQEALLREARPTPIPPKPPKGSWG